MKQFRILWKGTDASGEQEGEIMLEAHSRLAACFDALYRLRQRGIEITSIKSYEVIINELVLT